MIEQFKNYLLLISSFFILSGCGNDDNPFYFHVGGSTLEWIMPYEQEGQLINYTNEKNETLQVRVNYSSDFDAVNYIDCQMDGEIVQCEYESVLLMFPEEVQVDNQPVFISLLVRAEGHLRIMPSTTAGGFGATAVKYFGDTQEISVFPNENFRAIYKPDFIYEGESREAITVETLSTEGLATGGVIPPKRLILVKGIGVIEWDDYERNTWVLE